MSHLIKQCHSNGQATGLWQCSCSARFTDWQAARDHKIKLGKLRTPVSQDAKEMIVTKFPSGALDALPRR